MPKVSDAHRRARRDEIAEAALRVLRRNGVANTSIAQIVEESGLSAGAIYANFENKAELARYIAQSLFDWRLQRVTEPQEAVRSPAEVVRLLLSTTTEAAPPVAVVLQFWGEAARDDELRAVLTEKVTRLREAFAQAVLPWARQRDPADAEALAARTAIAMVVLCQGFLTNRALLGWTTAEDHLDAVEVMFRS
ncbi:TetR/AcrR family transcriptional regulator [uncultured Amnibacterium sp.]|uniref:TetR/AcrR family transcriptional regulator n=1 Tax=uncultured Amnibacterium sp. TaxID=1631851 RepID=UPI0035CAE812